MHTEKWEAAYHGAVLEVDRQKMPERIIAARQAITDRLQGLYGGSAFGECLTTVALKPSIEIEQATFSYSFQVP